MSKASLLRLLCGSARVWCVYTVLEPSIIMADATQESTPNEEAPRAEAQEAIHVTDSMSGCAQ